MKILKAYFAGLKTACSSIKMITAIYIVIFLLALIIAVPFRTAISNEAGNSMALHSLLKHFDYTSFSDFMSVSGKSINTVIISAIWMGGIYFLFTVFFTGGMLNILNSETRRFSGSAFLSGCGKFFFRYLRLGIYLLIFQLLITLIVFFPLGKILSNNYDTTQNEASLFYIFCIGIFIFAAMFVLILLVGDYAKIILFNSDSKGVIKALGRSFRFVFKHLFGTYTLYLIILAVLVLCIVLYFFLDEVIGMTSGPAILVMFLFQQAFIFIRVLIKAWFLGSELSFYKIMSRPEVELLPDEVIGDRLSMGGNNSIIEDTQMI